jgi:MtN3 and saliva related transmembrane protein
MSAVTLLGFVAAACTTMCYVPQVVKAWRSKSTKDISWVMFSLLAFGVTLWIIYASIRSDIPLAASNLIALILTSIVLVLKARYG